MDSSTARVRYGSSSTVAPCASNVRPRSPQRGDAARQSSMAAVGSLTYISDAKRVRARHRRVPPARAPAIDGGRNPDQPCLAYVDSTREPHEAHDIRKCTEFGSRHDETNGHTPHHLPIGPIRRTLIGSVIAVIEPGNSKTECFESIGPPSHRLDRVPVQVTVGGVHDVEVLPGWSPRNRTRVVHLGAHVEA